MYINLKKIIWMDENLLQTQYDVTKKSRLKKFYESNKIIIFSIILIIVITIVGLGFYLQIKEKEKIREKILKYYRKIPF